MRADGRGYLTNEELAARVGTPIESYVEYPFGSFSVIGQSGGSIVVMLPEAVLLGLG